MAAARREDPQASRRTRDGGASDERAEAAQGDYRIGTVSQLTGLDPHTIRAWERRYGAIRPHRSEGGTRLYGDAEVARLRLLRALSECGDPIGRIAGLSDDALRERLAKLAGMPEASELPALSTDGRPLRLGLLDPGLAEQLRVSAEGTAGLTLEASGDDAEALRRALQAQPVDVLVLSLDRMGEEPAALLEELQGLSRARMAVVLYHFGRRADLAALAERGAKVVMGPLRAAELRRLLFDLLVIQEARSRRPAVEPAAPAGEAEAEPPARRFDDRQIARLREVASSVDCECPNHLSVIIASLVSFERYSRGCASRTPADAALHGRLARGTGQARALMEELLEELCEHDRIRI